MQDQAFAIILIDVDYFTRVNEEYGRTLGDQVLNQIAQRLTKIALSSKVNVARLYADRFALLIAQMDDDQSGLLELRDCYHILSEPYFVKEEALHLTFSLALVKSTDVDTLDSLMKKADMTIFEIKRTGRNAYRVA